MGWTEKALQKHKMQKLVEEVMSSPEYKERERQMEAQWTANALARFTFMMCGFLETKHNYKKEGLKKFLKFVYAGLEETNDNPDFFTGYDSYYKTELGLDVLGELGLAIEKEGADSGESGPQTDTE